MPRAWREALERAREGKIAFLDHAWKGERVLKVLCANRERLVQWGRRMGLKESYIHDSRLPHFDLRGQKRTELLQQLR